MREVWSYFERVQEKIIQQAQLYLQDERDMLLVHALRLLFHHKLTQIRAVEKKALLGQATTQDQWPYDIPEERCYRFLTRSLDCFDTLLSSFLLLVRKIEAHNKSPSNHVEGLQAMANGLVRRRLYAPISSIMACNMSCHTQLNQDHLHTPDNLVWPFQELEIEKLVPTGSAPSIEWRDFYYETLDATDLPDQCTSAFVAALETIMVAEGPWIDIMSDTLDTYWWESAEGLLEQKKFTEALASMTLEISKFLHAHKYDIGVILPGGSQVFYPSANRRAGNFVMIYIKVNEDLGDKDTRFRFLPVEKGEHFSARTDPPTQTIKFLELPPEIRNVIYEGVLSRDTEDATSLQSLPRKQPALALTCRAVNEEFLSLLWRKHGWLVCG